MYTCNKRKKIKAFYYPTTMIFVIETGRTGTEHI